MRNFVKSLLIGAAFWATAFATSADAYMACHYAQIEGDSLLGETIYINFVARQYTVGKGWTMLQGTFNRPDLIHAIVECQADGDELAFIRKNFTGLRDVKHAPSVHYNGADALFLFDNLQ